MSQVHAESQAALEVAVQRADEVRPERPAHAEPPESQVALDQQDKEEHEDKMESLDRPDPLDREESKDPEVAPESKVCVVRMENKDLAVRAVVLERAVLAELMDSPERRDLEVPEENQVRVLPSCCP